MDSVEQGGTALIATVGQDEHTFNCLLLLFQSGILGLLGVEANAQVQHLLLQSLVVAFELANRLQNRFKAKHIVQDFDPDSKTTTDCFSRWQSRGLHPVGALSAPPLELKHTQPVYSTRIQILTRQK